MSTEADRLQLLYEVNRSLTTFVDLDRLLAYATRRARELFEASGCALLLLDDDRREFHFPVASQGESQSAAAERLSELRFPATAGVAGWVLAHDEALLVPDASNDPRFYSAVDHATGMTTRTILCAPLRTRGGNIGVIELINPGRQASGEDLRFLEALAGDIAVAYEKTALYERLGNEVIRLRQVCRGAGFVLVALGAVLGLGAVYVNLALALPLRQLPSRPGVVDGLACLVIGFVLLALARLRVGRPGAA
jgi:GAF domain-containing protein